MSLFGRKPRTLGEVVRRAKAGEQRFDPSLREFLDSFYVNLDSRQQAIDERPDSIDAVHDAYVAAVAEHLARVYGLRIPEWSETHGNGLREPFFAGGLQSLKGGAGRREPNSLSSAPLVREQGRTFAPKNVVAGRHVDAQEHTGLGCRLTPEN